MNTEVIKSIQNSDRDVLMAIKELYWIEKFDLDPCYSVWKFYEDIERPRIKMDKTPKEYNDKLFNEQIIQNDIMDWIPLDDNSIWSIVFDPPFMFWKHWKTDENIMAKRFSMFDKWNDLENMYKKSLSEFYRILKKWGIVAFKCQDYTDSKTTLTHCYVHNRALEQWFKIEDLFIMIFKWWRIRNSNLIQRHSRKYHSYWLILRK